jgi:hypothetical protein
MSKEHRPHSADTSYGEEQDSERCEDSWLGHNRGRVKPNAPHNRLARERSGITSPG